MTTSKSLKVLKRVAIVLLIAVFSIAGIVSCGGAEDIVGNRVDKTFIQEPEETGPLNTDLTSRELEYKSEVTMPDSEPEKPADLGDNNGDHNSTAWNLAETKGKSFYAASYRTIFVPLHSASSDWGTWFGVSYNDTDRLTRLWKAMIDRGIRDGKRRMYIKTHDGNFFFDANYNIRWSKKPDVIMKRFQGGAIVKLWEGYGNNDHSAAEERRGGVKFSGSYAIAGLYTFADSLYNVNNKYHSESLNYFFNWRYTTSGGKQLIPEYQQYVAQTAGGAMELIALHRGYPVDLGTGKYFVGRTGTSADWSGTAYAVQTYKEKNQTDIGYRDGNHHLANIKGNAPERYMPAMGIHQLYHLGYRWATDKTYYPDNFN